MISGIISTLLFALNVKRKWTAVIVIAVMITVNRLNPFAIKVVHGYVSWILFATLFIPEGEGSILLKRKSVSEWSMPESVQLALTIIITFSISYSGISKFLSPLWRSGEALDLFMQNPRFNWQLSEYLQQTPWFGKIATHLVWISEILFFPFYFFKKTRFIAWVGGMILIAAFFSLMHIYVVSMMMLIILSFLYPPQEHNAKS